MSVTPAWLAAIEAFINRGIASSAAACAVAQRLNTKALRLEVAGLLPIRVSVTGGTLGLVASDEPADATITGSPFALLQLARGGASRNQNSATAQVQGDAEIANLYRQLFSLARPDLEEEMSRIVGDLPARHISQLAQQAFGWARKVRRTVGENLAEYLQEEGRDLVNKPELEEFLQGVDTVREATDRIEARLGRLEQRLQSSG